MPLSVFVRVGLLLMFYYFRNIIDQQGRALDILQAEGSCRSACTIGTVSDYSSGIVSAITAIGGSRVLDMLSGVQLPRIC